MVTGQLLAVFLEEMMLGDDDRGARIERRADATAAVVFPGPVPDSDPDPAAEWPVRITRPIAIRT